MEGLKKSNIEGLTFTYNGGYRVLIGTKRIEKLEDFKGMKIRKSLSPVAEEIFTILGVTSVPVAFSKIEESIKTNKIELAESTYSRFYPLEQNKAATLINETNHSLFLTSIILNEDFYKKLPDNYKKIVKNAAILASRNEINKSIDSSDDTKQKCRKDGIEVISMSRSESDRFKKAVFSVYKKYESMLSEELIASIKIQ